MTLDSMFEIGRPDLMEASVGLGQVAAAQIGAITIFAGNIEFRLERAIWRLQDHAPRGVRHATDAKPISELIDMFETEGTKRLLDTERQLIQLWCDTARPAFDFRHSIAHGAVFRIGTKGIQIERNRSWEGELRKRPAASLWGDESTFGNIRLTFAVLLQTINSISNPKRSVEEVASSPERIAALKGAKSLMGEMVSGHGPWFEKY